MPPIDYRSTQWGPLLFESKVDSGLVDLLLEKGNESRKNNLDAKRTLAGMLENQFYYENYEDWFVPKFNIYLYSYVDALYKSSDFNVDNDENLKEGWISNNLWINYQKLSEYNPPHNHDGGLSFVIYLQIPDELKKEYEMTKDNHNNSGPGSISFNYGEQLPFNVNSKTRFPEVRDLFIFPSWLTHHVFAFNSDVERISVSGNLSWFPTQEN